MMEYGQSEEMRFSMETEKIINAFVDAIDNGKFTLEEVPAEYREAVSTKLNERQ